MLTQKSQLVTNSKLDEFLEFGFTNLGWPENLDLDAFDQFEFINVENLSTDFELEFDMKCGDFSRLELALREQIKQIGFHLVELRNFGFWDGVDRDSELWHNDFIEGKGLNSSALVYLDDQAESLGGSLCIKSPFKETKVVPRQKQIVLLNQSKNYFHRADRTSNRRRIISFEYWIEKEI